MFLAHEGGLHPFGRLSVAHQRVLAFGCGREIHLDVRRERRGDSDGGLKPLLKAIRRNACPSQLTFQGFYPPRQIDAIVEALAWNTSVETVSFEFAPCERLLRLSRNTGLRHLHVSHVGAKLEEAGCWTSFWTMVASNPTMRVLDLGHVNLADRSNTQLEEMSQILQSSTSLQYLCTNELFHSRPALRDQALLRSNSLIQSSWCDRFERIPILQDRVLPVLVLNRFRPKVSAILNESDPETRARLFRLLLLGDVAVRNDPVLLHYLLKSATDLFIECLPRRKGAIKDAGRTL